MEALLLASFRGFNSADVPQNLPLSTGVRCRNFRFADGKLFPRFGYAKVRAGHANAATTYNASRGIFAARVQGAVYGTNTTLWTCHRKTSDNTEEINSWPDLDGTPVSEKTGLAAVTDVQSESNFHLFNGRPLFFNGKNILYWSGTTGNTWYKLTLAALAAPALAAGAAGILNGTYKYYLVREDPNTGALSLPSPLSTVSVSATKVDVTIPADLDYYRRVYRTGGANTTARLVYTETVQSGVTFHDNTADADLGEEMLTNNDPMPTVMYGDSYHNRFIGMFDGTNNERDFLYVSYEGQPWRCPTVTDLEDPQDGARFQLPSTHQTIGTGLKSFGDIAVVFSLKEAYILSGNDPSSYSLNKAWDIGCISGRTIKNGDGLLFWLAADDLWAWDGNGAPIRASGAIQDKIRRFTEAEKRAAFAEYWDGAYYLFIGGQVYFIDVRQSFPHGTGDGVPVFAWGQVTGWSFVSAHHLPASNNASDTYSEDNVFFQSATVATHPPYKHNRNQFSDAGTVISCEWRSSFLPGPHLDTPAKRWRLRRITLLAQADASDGYTRSPAGAAATGSLLVYSNGDPTPAETHTVTFYDGESGAEDLIEYLADCGRNDSGRFLQVGVTCEGFSDDGVRMIPQIESIELGLVPIR